MRQINNNLKTKASLKEEIEALYKSWDDDNSGILTLDKLADPL